MAAGIPPPPLNSPSGSYYWLEWYTQLTNILNGTGYPWTALNFANSDIADIKQRNHNELTNIQGGTASGGTPGTGLAYHLLGYGACDALVTVSSVPSGWSVAHTSTGTYTVTHNLGLAFPDYMAGATANSAASIVTWVDTSNSNSFVVHVASTAALGTAQDSSISFWLGKI